MLRLLMLILICAFASSALGQFDSGVVIDEDEFTGDSKCQQLVSVSLTDMTGFFVSNDGGTIFIGVMRGRVEDNTFNMFGTSPGDLVYIRWPDGTVREYEPVESIYDYDRDYEVAVLVVPGLIFDIMSSPGDLRVRFDGSMGREDFTIPHSLVLLLADGFGKQCLE